MVLLAELLLALFIIVGVYRFATKPAEGMADVEPDRRPIERKDGPLTADELVAFHLPAGVGYRKLDVDRLLDRVARQLPRAIAPQQEELAVGGAEEIRPADRTSVSLEKEPEHG